MKPLTLLIDVARVWRPLARCLGCRRRYHVHMNSTKWLTLTEFVKYLGREGKCKVEETPKGWYITLIHKDPAEVGGI